MFTLLERAHHRLHERWLYPRDSNKFLEDARWVVRGRKGTGKSTLFHLFVEHQDNAEKRARGKLTGIHILPGHGPVADATLRPTTDVFEEIQRSIQQSKVNRIVALNNSPSSANSTRSPISRMIIGTPRPSPSK